MRRGLILLGLPVAALLGLIWLAGGFEGLLRGAVALQREAQEALAGAVRALRAGQPGALAGLIGISFAYGVLHAVGPGHGKALVAAYGAGRRVPVARLAALAFVASLAQAAVAVTLVYAVVGLLGLTRDAATGAAERWVTPLGDAMIAALGLWLLMRGLRGLWRRRAAAPGGHDDHGHHHGHHHHGHDHGADRGPRAEGQDESCGCGHAHAPTVAQVERLAGWRDAALLVAGIALRPCSGAVFLLVLTWQLGFGGAGIAGAFAMGLGVASVTVAAALVAAWAREGALAGLSGGAAARALPVIEAAFGALILATGLVMLSRAL